jgi:hypothetical protein
MGDGRFKKGNPGKPKGAKTKTTAAIKDMIEQALSNVGGVAYLQRQADENPVAFMGLVGKILPKDLNIGGELGVNLVIRRSFVRKKPE